MAKLFWKYLFAFWVAVLAIELAVTLTSSVLRQFGQVPTLAAQTRELRARVDTLTALLRDGRVYDATRTLAQFAGAAAAPEIFVLDARGHELLDRAISADDRQFALAPDSQDAPFSQRVDGPAGARYAVFIHENVAGRIMYRTRIQITRQYEFIAALLVGFCFSAFMAWYWLAPLRSLRWALSNIAEGRLHTRVMPRMGGRRDEFASLGSAFDSMAQRIEQLVHAQRRLLHDVSHELRSPLARLEAAVALAMRRHGDALAPEMGRITREAQRLNGLVSELLLLARLENGIDTVQRGSVDVMELVVAIADDAQFEARAKQRDLQLACDGQFVADVSAEVLYRAFENVIRNAVKYTQPGTTVQVRAHAAGEAMVVAVTDQGPGLPDDALAAIFEPFRRFETDPEVGGFGLGLAIAKHAMELHGGAIVVERGRESGLTFTLTLTRAGLHRTGQAPAPTPR